MTVKEFCKKYGLTEDQFYGREEYSGSLYLRSLTSIPEGFNPTVGGYLYLSSLTSIPEGFNPTVGGSLDLRSLTSIPEGFNPTVGGYLYLRSLTSIPEGFNPTVGGYLYLSSLTSIPEGFNPTVGGSLYLRSGLSAPTRPYIARILEWQGGKYISADGVFTEVIAKKGRLYEVRKVGEKATSFLATDGNAFHAHGATKEQAKADLRFKIAAENFKNEPIKPKQIITLSQFRIITGACQSGCEAWCRENGIEPTKLRADKLLAKLKATNAFGWQKFESLMQGAAA